MQRLSRYRTGVDKLEMIEATRWTQTCSSEPLKLRFHDNSIRLRLTRSEVARFTTEGRVEAVLKFGPDSSQRVIYSLEAVPGLTSMSVYGSAEYLRICVPSAIAQEWTGTDRIAISARQSVDSQEELDILVEKEFRQLHGAKFNPDLYPNPLESSLAGQGRGKMKV